MSQPPSPGGWPDPYGASPGQPSGAGPPTQPAYPPPAYPPPPAYGAVGGPPGYGPPPGYPGYPMPVPAPTNGLAIAAMVCALSGLAVGISAPVGAILGHVARRQIRERGEEGDGLALTGIIVGWSLTGLMVLCCGGYIALVGFAMSQPI